MHRVKQQWPVTPNWQTDVIRSGTIEIRAVTGLFQTALSGNLDRALTSLDHDGRRVGFWEIASGDIHVISIAHDKALLVSAKAIPLAEGWCDEGWAALRADDASIVLSLEGEGLDGLMSEMGLVVDDAESASAAIMFAGVRLLVYRVAEHAARIHVAASHAPFLWQWLSTRERPCAAFSLPFGEHCFAGYINQRFEREDEHETGKDCHCRVRRRGLVMGAGVCTGGL